MESSNWKGPPRDVQDGRILRSLSEGGARKSSAKRQRVYLGPGSLLFGGKIKAASLSHRFSLLHLGDGGLW